MKHTIRTLLCLFLVLAMTFSLAACGNKEETPENRSKDDSNGEMVYTAKSVRVDPTLLPDGIQPSVYTDDGFYGTSYGKIADGVVPEGATVEWEGQYDIYGNKLYFVGFDGSVRELTGYKPLEGKEDTEERTNYSSGSSLCKILLNNAGDLVLIENVYTNWFDGTQAEYEAETWDDSYWDKYKSEQQYYVRIVDTNGAEKSCSAMDFSEENVWLDFDRSVVDNEGRIIVVGDQTIYAFDPDGSLAFRIEGDFWPNGIVLLRDGTVAVSGWGETNLKLYPLDIQKRGYGKAVDMPSNAYSMMPGTAGYDFFYQDGMYLYGYSLETGEKTKIINWLDVDINSNYVSGQVVKEDGTIFCVLNSWKEDAVQTELVTAMKVPADSVPKKETLTMAVMYAGELYDKVVDFNRHNDKVRIQILDYSEFNDYENGDYDAGRTKLLTEILSGNVPDIIALDQLPYKQFAAKGLLEDLYPYIERDPDMSREDFFPNVFQALEVDGKLYEITPSFNVQTLIGAASVVGTKPGWTYQDLKDALATMPEGCDPLDMYTTREDMLRTLLCADMDHYVDWSTGKCSFESDDFIELLEFVGMFPDSIPDDIEWESSSDRIAQGRQMLTSAYLYSVDSILWSDMQFGDAGCTYIGYPTNEGVGSMMYLDAGYGMSAACRNKDAAWEFLRSFLLKDAQENVWGIPVSKAVFQEKLDEVMTPEYVTDENGKIMLDENGEKMQVSRGSYWDDDGEHPIYAMTREQADKLLEAITTCTKVYNNDDSIYKIVFEQAQAYFSGQKSARDVAKLIQSKVTIYVNEQR